MSWHPVLSGGPAVSKGTFAISAARQIRDRLNMRPPELNIYTSQSNTDNARFCCGQGRAQDHDTGAWAVKTAEADRLVPGLDLAGIGRFVAAALGICGHPRTHTTWHRVAPRLSGSFFVVCPDLRGYGESTLPPDAPGHAQSSKRAMAGDVVALMRHLGHDRFSVVGHDRGALVAFPTAMDHPDAVKRLVVMDGLPVIEQLERPNEAFVRTWWHWWFLGQTDKPAEYRATCRISVPGLPIDVIQSDR